MSTKGTSIQCFFLPLNNNLNLMQISVITICKAGTKYTSGSNKTIHFPLWLQLLSRIATTVFWIFNTKTIWYIDSFGPVSSSLLFMSWYFGPPPLLFIKSRIHLIFLEGYWIWKIPKESSIKTKMRRLVWIDQRIIKTNVLLDKCEFVQF